MTALTLAERRTGAVAHVLCDPDAGGCGRAPGARCVSKTGSGKAVTPHVTRLHDFDVWISRQPEVDALTQTIASLKAANDQLDSTLASSDAQIAQLAAQNTDFSRRVTEAAEDLATANEKILDLQNRIAELLAPPVQQLLRLDLSVVPLGKVTAASAGKMFGLPGKLAADGNWSRTTVVEDSPGGRRWLRQTFAAGAAGQGSANGISLGVPFPGGERVDKATIAMAIRCSPGFDAAYGVKGPGLVGLTPDQPSLTFPSGNKPDPLGQGLSARFMLFNQKSLGGHAFVHPNEFTPYTYHNTLREQYIWTGVPIQPGRAYEIRETIELNAPSSLPAADGVVKVSIDDQLVVDRDDYDWRKRPDLSLVGLIWSVFRGGPNGNPLYEQATASYIEIADGLTVTTPAA